MSDLTGIISRGWEAKKQLREYMSTTKKRAFDTQGVISELYESKTSLFLKETKKLGLTNKALFRITWEVLDEIANGAYIYKIIGMRYKGEGKINTFELVFRSGTEDFFYNRVMTETGASREAVAKVFDNMYIKVVFLGGTAHIDIHSSKENHTVKEANF